MADQNGLLARYGLGGTSLDELRNPEEGAAGLVYGYRVGLLRVGIVVYDGIGTRIRPRIPQAIRNSMEALTESLSDHCVDLSEERIYSQEPSNFRSVAARREIENITRGLIGKALDVARHVQRQRLLAHGRTYAYQNGFIKGDPNNIWDVRTTSDGEDVVYGNKVRYAGFLEVGAPRGQDREPKHILRDAIRMVSEEITQTFQQHFAKTL